MQTLVLRTRLKPGKETEYEAVHAVIPDDLDAALREGGVHSWRIWRSGLDLFHLVEVEGYERLKEHLRDHPADKAWQARINLLLDGDFDPAAALPHLVWQLP
ncbi:L-rhamnose mutarotase [Nonomuraea mangrovi]|uniref:L-rhamnose mutarotase n=1 Tax=Nonomuraea mangrovi TaxID=2316207 RepID=A0ABW4T075_9ACTN